MSDWTITEPRVVDGMPDDVYHADPVPGGSLSASGAKTLLKAPAKFAYEREHGRPDKKEYDLGHAAHRLVLGVGPELVLVDRPRWDTKEVKAELAEIRARGAVPLKRPEMDTAHAMALKLRQHPIASVLLDPDRGGKPEQSMFWAGDEVWLRARLDWLPKPAQSGRPIIPDYKTCDDASREAVRKACYRYGYYIQATWYLAAVDNLLDWADAAFLFIFQEKTPPYLVTVAELDAPALREGHAAMRRAIDAYRNCTETGHWPGYSDDVELIDLPPYARTIAEESHW